MTTGQDDGLNGRGRRSASPRRLTTVVIATLLLLLFATLALWTALQLRPVRQTIAERVAELVHHRSGLQLAVDDWSLKPLAGRLEVHAPRLSTATGSVFFTAKHLQVGVRWRSLVGRRIVLPVLSLEKPEVDLGLLPQPSGGEEPATAVPGFDILALRISAGRLFADSAPDSLQGLMESWHLQGIELSGSYRDGVLAASLEEATLVAIGGAVEDLELDLSGRIHRSTGGVISIDDFEARGRGLETKLSVRAGPDPGHPLEVTFALEAQPGLLFPGLIDAGRARGAGRLDLRRLTGEASLDIENLPADVLQPWLGRDLFARLGQLESRLDLAAELKAAQGLSDPVQGRVDITWRQRERRLLEGRVRLTDGQIGADGRLDLHTLAGEIRLEARNLPAELLQLFGYRQILAQPMVRESELDLQADLRLDPGPDAAALGQAGLTWRQGGRTLLQGTVRTRGGSFGPSGRLDLKDLESQVELQAYDLPPELFEPWLGRETLDRVAARGSRLDLELETRLNSLSRPVDGQAQLVWRRNGTRLLEASVRPTAGPGDTTSLTLAFEASLLPAAGGSRRLQGEVDIGDWSRIAQGQLSAQASVELPDLAAARTELDESFPSLLPLDLQVWPLRGALTASTRLHGALVEPHLDLEAVWRPGGESALRLEATGYPQDLRGQARVTLEAFDLAHLDARLQGKVAGSGSLRGSRAGIEADAVVDAVNFTAGKDLPSIDQLHAELQTDGREVRLESLVAALDGRQVTASGAFDLGQPPQQAHLLVELWDPVPAVQKLAVTASLEAGVLRVETTEFRSRLGDGSLTAVVPLSSLASVPGLGEQVADWRLDGARGPIVLTVAVPELDSRDLAIWGLDESGERIRAQGFRLELHLDPGDLVDSSGRVELTSFDLDTQGHSFSTTEPVRLSLAQRRLELESIALQLDGLPLTLSGTARLAARWQPGMAPASIFEEIDLRAQGSLDASFLNPYLAGGVASGPVAVDLALQGPADALEGQAWLDGTEASLLYPAPYLTRFENIQLELTVSDGQIRISDGKARLNDGSVTFSGEIGESGLILDTYYRDVRYRFDYGLSAILSGDLLFAAPPDARSQISGRLVLHRGVVRKDLSLEREIFGSLFAVELEGTEASAAEAVDLDISVTTQEGVRIDNNLADLRARWTQLEIRGNLAEPQVSGRIRMEPGGLLFLYGQVVRVDSGTLTFTGEPGEPPTLDLTTTSSLRDPTLKNLAGPQQSLWQTGAASPEPDEQAELQENVASGLAAYYGSQLTSQLGGLGETEISVRPVLVFGETDPGARLTISRNLSAQVALAISTNLRDAQSQTYLLELHDFPQVPSLSAQVFTKEGGSEESTEGATLQHTLAFGAGGEGPPIGPDLRELRVDPPEGISARRLRQAVALDKGDPLPEGSTFDIEVAIAEFLSQRGYPGARVRAWTEPVPAPNRVDVVVEIEPGPKVDFEFRGPKIPRSLQRGITSLYRVDFYEDASLEEVRAQTVKALRSQGYLYPEVDISVERAKPDLSANRTVIVHCQGASKTPIDEVVFRGISGEDAEVLAGRFAGPLERAELAAGTVDAERFLRKSLASLGYPDAVVASTRLSDDGVLSVDLEPGRRQIVADLGIEGAEEGMLDGLPEKLPVRPGDPARSSRIASGAVRIEDHLRSRGYADARARAHVSSITPERPYDLRLIYEVDPGSQYRVQEVEFQGLQASRPSWARSLVRLEPGSVLQEQEIAEARWRLLDSGVFAKVRSDTQRQSDGDALVTFDVQERSRYTVAYGLRWESEEGLGAVVDLLDRNFLGRGFTLGIRGLWSQDEKRARLYAGVPHLLGTNSSLDFFLEGSDLVEFDDQLGGEVLIDRLEGTLQLSIPLTRFTTSRVYGRLRNETIVEADPIDPEFPFEQRLSTPFFGLQILYDSRTDPTAPAGGLFASADLSTTGAFLSNEIDYVRFFGQVNLYPTVAKLGNKRLTWAQSYRIGLAETFSFELPFTEAFFAGGPFSVRGYTTDGLGPVDPGSGAATGGEALFVSNQELRFHIWDRLGGVVFFDVGNVWETTSEFGTDLFKGAGLGFRASSPVGPLRLDLAWPLDRREDDPSFKVYFGFGHIF